MKHGINLRQINNYHVKEIKMPPKSNLKVKGSDLSVGAYQNIFLVAKRKSGKTVTLMNLIRECMTKRTHLILFCSTLFKDAQWIAFRKELIKKGIEFTGYTSLYENGEDNIKNLLDDLNEEAKEREEAEDDDENDEKEEQKDDVDTILEKVKKYGVQGYLEMEEEEIKVKHKKSKYVPLDYMTLVQGLHWIYDNLRNKK